MLSKSDKARFLDVLKSTFGEKIFTRKEVLELASQHGIQTLGWFLNSSEFKVTRGKYQFLSNVNYSERNDMVDNGNNQSIVQNFVTDVVKESLVPESDRLFVKHGDFDLVSRIVGSNKFYPIFITGLSGNGKTFGVEQACALHKRELYRVNITIETDEDDLLGGFRLVNDSTKWFDGPVIRAMKSGGVLLLDEVDLGSNKLLCLQPILEGKGILLKKINQYVRPAPGFTVVATANTKGQGSESRKFVGTNILNEAFLERFCATFEQKYPEEKVEKSILKKLCDSHDLNGESVEDFVQKLVTWAFGTRKTFEAGGTSDLISTRRLVHIINAYAILGHPKTDDKKEVGEIRRQAIEMCISRFDDSTKTSFMNFYENIDPYLNVDVVVPQEPAEPTLEAKEHDIISILTNQG